MVDREEEEEEKDMISLWKKQGKAGEGMGVILTRCGTIVRLCSQPLLHYCQYTPLNCTSGTVSGAKPSKTTCHLSITREEGAGTMMSGPLVIGSSQTVAPFQFPFIVLLHGRGTFFNFNPRPLLQLQSLPPTSSLIALNFNPCRLSISKPRRFSISSPCP
jgi:hypothetical protein